MGDRSFTNKQINGEKGKTLCNLKTDVVEMQIENWLCCGIGTNNVNVSLCVGWSDGLLRQGG